MKQCGSRYDSGCSLDDVTPRPVTGYACTVNGAIRVDTVSPSRQAAIVNGLTTLFGVLVTRHHSREWINEAWEKLTAESSNAHDIISVTINPD